MWLNSKLNGALTVPVATIIGIDPGSESLGVSKIVFDVYTGKLIDVSAMTYVGSKFERPSYIAEVHGDRLSRIKAHEDNLYTVFFEAQPYAVACESPFINMRRPQAYGALTEVVCAVRSALYRYNQYQPLYMVEPSVVKRAVRAKGNADKDAVKLALSNCTEIMTAMSTSFQSLDEHSVDAIAVGYAHYQSLFNL